MKKFAILLIAIFLIQCANKAEKNEKYEESETTEVAENIVEEASLYERLGGTEGISAIVDDIVDEHLKNPVISDVFMPLTENEERFNTFKDHVKEFFAAGTGGSVEYTGKDLPTAHQGMNVNDEQLVAAFDDILLVLQNHEIDLETQKDVLYILYSLKGQVVGK